MKYLFLQGLGVFEAFVCLFGCYPEHNMVSIIILILPTGELRTGREERGFPALTNLAKVVQCVQLRGNEMQASLRFTIPPFGSRYLWLSEWAAAY